MVSGPAQQLTREPARLPILARGVSARCAPSVSQRAVRSLHGARRVPRPRCQCVLHVLAKMTIES